MNRIYSYFWVTNIFLYFPSYCERNLMHISSSTILLGVCLSVQRTLFGGHTHKLHENTTIIINVSFLPMNWIGKSEWIRIVSVWTFNCSILSGKRSQYEGIIHHNFYIFISEQELIEALYMSTKPKTKIMLFPLYSYLCVWPFTHDTSERTHSRTIQRTYIYEERNNPICDHVDNINIRVYQ